MTEYTYGGMTANDYENWHEVMTAENGTWFCKCGLDYPNDVKNCLLCKENQNETNSQSNQICLPV